MTNISINTELCTGCSLCVKLCPYSILEMKDGAETASVNPAFAPVCSQCGHCYAICPEGAITVDYEGEGPVPSLDDESYPTIGQMNKLVTMRRSIRSYKTKKVPRDILEKILDIVRYAPTGMNGQTVHWMVIENPEDVQKLVAGVIGWAGELVKKSPNHPLAPIIPMCIDAWKRGEDHICHGSPHLIIAYAHKDNPIGFIDATIALTHLDLVAPVFDLGTCWAGILQIALDDSPALMESLGLPKDHKSMYAMMIGYPTHQYRRIPKRNALSVIWK